MLPADNSLGYAAFAELAGDLLLLTGAGSATIAKAYDRAGQLFEWAMNYDMVSGYEAANDRVAAKAALVRYGQRPRS